MLAKNAAAFSYSAAVIVLLAWISRRAPTAGLNWRRALDDRFSTSFPAWMTAQAKGRADGYRRGCVARRIHEREEMTLAASAPVTNVAHVTGLRRSNINDR